MDLPIPGSIVDRLRDTTRAAGISLRESDVEQLLERGMLRNAVAFDALVAHTPSDLLPDYLAAWGTTPDDVPAPPVGTDAAPGRPGPPETPHDSAAPASTESIVAIARAIRAREVSPLELTRQALARIAEQDVVLNAFQCVLADRALATARVAEAEIARGENRGALHGVPVAVKDLLMMRGTITTAGSKILGDWHTEEDAAGVARIEAAGAVIVGKTRLPEFAYSPGSNNAHYGSTRNPWNHAHDAGGSSSGSAAAVAARQVYAALGSDTGGSIRIPAAHCGIVGLKPTYGRVSLHGAVTLAWSLDHLGPITRCVADAALVLEVLEGRDPRDPRSRSVPEHGRVVHRSFSGALQADGRALRIGVLRDDGSGGPPASPPALAAWHAGLQALEAQGAHLVPLDLPELQGLRVVHGAILGIEATAYHQPMLRTRLDDFGEYPRTRLLSAYAYGPRAFIRAQQALGVLRRRFAAIFDEVDLLSTPAMPDAAPLLGTPGSTAMTAPFNALGWPAISVPVGLTADGLPVGLQLAGRPWDDATVLRAAQALESYGPWQARRPV